MERHPLKDMGQQALAETVARARGFEIEVLVDLPESVLLGMLPKMEVSLANLEVPGTSFDSEHVRYIGPDGAPVGNRHGTSTKW